MIFYLGGYFSYSLSSQLKIVSLNTALYYSMNNLTIASNNYDPSGQLMWLTSELEKAKLINQKVRLKAADFFLVVN